MQAGRTAVEVAGVSKRYRIFHERNRSLKSALMRGRRASYEDFWALRDVSFAVPRGATFGLVGDNGSGKSTLLKCMARILQPDEGAINVDGTMAALLEVGSGFHPELSGRENVYLNGSILGLSRAEITARFDEIVDFAGVREFIDQPVKNYSSGQYVRLGFSVAVSVNPDVLLVDEVLAVGDASFQDKCAAKFAEFRRAGKTVIIVSHALGTMRSMCDEVAWLDHGRLIGTGDAADLVARYQSASTGSTEVVNATSVMHHGDGQAHIDRLEMRDIDGDPVRHLAAGAAVTIEISWTCPSMLGPVVVGLGIETTDGVQLWGSNTREAGIDVDGAAGSHLTRFELRDLPLQGRRFGLVAAVTDMTTSHVYDFVRGALDFSIAEVKPPQTGGPTYVQGKWSTVQPSWEVAR